MSATSSSSSSKRSRSPSKGSKPHSRSSSNNSTNSSNNSDSGDVLLVDLVIINSHLITITCPVTVRDSSNSIKRCANLYDLLSPYDIRIPRSSISKVRTLMEIPLYLGAIESSFRTAFAKFRPIFPLVQTVDNDLRRHCAVVINNHSNDISMAPPTGEDFLIKDTATFWMSWIEKFVLVCLMVFASGEFEFVTSADKIVAPGVIQTLFSKHCRVRSIKPFPAFNSGDTSPNDKARNEIFDAILNWDYWRYGRNHKYIKETTREGDVEKKTIVQSQLYYVMMIGHALQSLNVPLYQHVGWIRALLMNQRYGQNDGKVVPEYRKDPTLIDSLGRDIKRIEGNLFSHSLSINSFLKTGVKSYGKFSRWEDSTHTDLIDPHIPLLPYDFSYRTMITKASFVPSSSSRKMVGYPITATTLQDLEALFRYTCEIQLLHTLCDPKKNTRTERYAYFFVDKHLACIVRDYIFLVMQIFRLSAVDDPLYSPANIRCYDVYHPSYSSLQVLVIAPSEIVMAVNHFGFLMSLSDANPLKSPLSCGVLPLMINVMNITRHTGSYLDPSTQTYGASFLQRRLYPVVMLCRSLVFRFTGLNYLDTVDERIRDHVTLIGRLFMILFKCENPKFKERCDVFLSDIPNLGEYLLAWIVMPYTQVRLKKELGIGSKSYFSELQSEPMKVVGRVRGLDGFYKGVIKDKATSSPIRVSEPATPSDLSTIEDITQDEATTLLLDSMTRLCNVVMTTPDTDQDYTLLECLFSLLLAPIVQMPMNRACYDSVFPFHIPRRDHGYSLVDNCFIDSTNGLHPKAVTFTPDIVSEDDLALYKGVILAMGVNIPVSEMRHMTMTLCSLPSIRVADLQIGSQSVVDHLFLPPFHRDANPIHPHVVSLLSTCSPTFHTAEATCPLFKSNTSSNTRSPQPTTALPPTPSPVHQPKPIYPYDNNNNNQSGMTEADIQEAMERNARDTDSDDDEEESKRGRSPPPPPLPPAKKPRVGSIPATATIPRVASTNKTSGSSSKAKPPSKQ